MKSLVVKRSIVIAGHKTSVSLEEPFWTGLKEIAHRWDMTLSTMVGDIDTASVEAVAACVTPVPGGVGPVTTAVLLRNVVVAAGGAP